MNNYILLLVDDEPDIQNSLKRNLRKWSVQNNITVESSNSGKEALKVLEEKSDRVAIIISDQKMPEITGSELLREVSSRYPHIVSIILTGHADTADISSFIEAGIFAFLEKPWDPPSLVSEVEKARQVYMLRKKTTEQEQLLQAELQLASEFQELFLKIEPPYSEYARFDFKHEHAKELSFGGDYYDIIQLGNEQFLLVIGDVAGHGLKASFLVAILKSIIYTEFIKQNRASYSTDYISPAQFLTWLNKRINSLLKRTPDIFLAFSACLIDAQNKTLAFANAGQPPLIIIADNGVKELTTTDVALGVKPEAKYTETFYSLNSGDIVFLCTDGFYPTGKEVRHFNKTMLFEILAEQRESDSFAESILRIAQNSEKQLLKEDDVTLLYVRIL